MKFSDTKYGNLSNKEISEEIRVSNNGLTSLVGSPKIVKEYFRCGGNLLKSLKGGPKEIRGDFFCSDNELISLVGRPKKIDGFFDCSNNKKLKNVKEEIIKNKIVAKQYFTDEGIFYYPEVRNLIEKEIKKEKEIYDKMYETDFGYGF